MSVWLQWHGNSMQCCTYDMDADGRQNWIGQHLKISRALELLQWTWTWTALARSPVCSLDRWGQVHTLPVLVVKIEERRNSLERRHSSKWLLPGPEKISRTSVIDNAADNDPLQHWALRAWCFFTWWNQCQNGQNGRPYDKESFMHPST